MELKGDLEMYFRNLKHLRHKVKLIQRATINDIEKDLKTLNDGLITIYEFSAFTELKNNRYQNLEDKLVNKMYCIYSLLDDLYKYPSDKMPPSLLYKKLVKITGERNDWTVLKWIKFLKGE